MGQTLEGRYRLDAPLGEGAMGEVYRGVQVSLERPVAVKVLPIRLLGERDLLQRFEREARLLSKLKHPGIVSVIDFGYADGRPYLVMELVAGGTLEELLLREGRLPPERVARILLELCGALEHAHGMGILHRDLKPANILMENGRARVVDFGVARAIEPIPASSITGEGMVIGTPKYCSPEQAMGLTLDGRSDLYSLGIVAWRALVGRVPFDGSSSAAIFAQHVGENAEPLVMAAQLTPEWAPLAEVIERLMAKTPEERYANAQETARALEAVLRGREGAPPAPEPSSDAPRPIVELVSDLGSESGFDPTLKRDPTPLVTPRPRGFVDRHPGIAGLVVVATIALGAWIATRAGREGGHAPVALPPAAVEARQLIAKGDVRKAMIKLEEAVEAAPRSPALRVALGHAYVRGDREEDAIPHYAWAARAPEVFDDEHRADLAKLTVDAKTQEGRVMIVAARERIGERVDLLGAAKTALASPRCDDRKAAIKVLADRKKPDGVPLLEQAAKEKRCGAADARRALEALGP